MNLLAQSVFLKALGWSLLHSLWQMGVLWLLYIILTSNGKRFQSRQRYNLSFLFIVAGSIAFLFTLIYQCYQGTESLIIYQQSSEIDTTASSFSTLFLQIVPFLESALPLLSIIYLFAVSLLSVRLYRQYFFSHTLITSGLKKISPELRTFLAELAQRFSIKKKIRIGLSDLVSTPLTVGFWKPVILLPIAAVNQLSLQQTEAIILHELNHIKQNDYLINLFVACLDILLFFNPFSRLLTGIIIRERENSCDDMVLQFRYSPADYAEALMILEQHRLLEVPVLAISATGSNKKLLLHRVQRILHGTAKHSPVNYTCIAFVFIALIIGFAGLLNPDKIIIQQSPALSANLLMNNPSETIPLLSTPSNINKTLFSLQAGFQKQTASAPLKKIEPAQWLSSKKEEELNKLLKVAMYEETNSHNYSLAGENNHLTDFVSDQQHQEFSLQENEATAIDPEDISEPQPYIPANSFSYQYMEDTTLPKRYVPAISELKAKENLEIAIKALEEINWHNLKKGLSGNNKQIDISLLQEELKKALAAIDWKKMQEELGTGLKQAEEELKLKQVYLSQLQKFQKAEAEQKQINDQKRQLILMERVMQNKELQKCEEDRKKSAEKKEKKVVVI